MENTVFAFMGAGALMIPPRSTDADERTHIYRGAPNVRSWSKYQETVEDWTLCGIRRIPRGDDKRRVATTEDPSEASCPYCQELMKPTKRELARAKRQRLAS